MGIGAQIGVWRLNAYEYGLSGLQHRPRYPWRCDWDLGFPTRSGSKAVRGARLSALQLYVAGATIDVVDMGNAVGQAEER